MGKIPRWLRNMMLAEDAAKYAEPPPLAHVIRRDGGDVPPQSPESFLRALELRNASDNQRAARYVDSQYSTDKNIFGNNLRTSDQSIADAMRQFKDFDKLSPSEQILLMGAIEKGAVLKGLPARNNSIGSTAFPANQLDAIDNDGYMPFHGMDEGHMPPGPSDVLGMILSRTKQGRVKTRSLPHIDNYPLPGSLFVHGGHPTGPGQAMRAMGDGYPDLAMQIRQDQINSRVLKTQELRDLIADVRFQNSASAAANKAAADEAYLRTVGPFDRDTISGMDRSVNAQRMREDGTMERLTGDPLHGLPRVERRMAAESAQEAHDRMMEGVDWPQYLKGVALGHLASYPTMYAAYVYQNPDDPFLKRAFGKPTGGMTSDEIMRMRRPMTGGMTSDEIIQERAIAAAKKASKSAGPLPEFDVPVELPDMPITSMPHDIVGVEDDPIGMTHLGGEEELSAEANAPPTIEELDNELRDYGLSGVPAWMKDRRIKSVKRLSPSGVMEEATSIYTPASRQYEVEQKYRNLGMKLPWEQ